MGTNWDQVAYNNAMSALQHGQPMSVINANQKDYVSANNRALADFNASKSRSTKKSSPAPVAKSTPLATAQKATTTTATPATETTPAPTLELPALELSENTSVANQLNKLSSKESLLTQQARVNAREKGAASGQIHSSQQEGAAARAVTDKLEPIAQAEATAAATQELSNWQNQTNQKLQEFEKQYTERIAKLGFDNDTKIAMTEANTKMSSSLMSAINQLLNNPEVEFGVEVKNKLVDIFNAAQENNNTILEMGFTY